MSSDFDGASFESDVDDPEALRRAEDAVAGRGTKSPRAGGPGVGRIDGAWTTIAAQVVPGESAGLEDVVRALESEGVDFGWDPYDPRDSVSFGPPQATTAVRKLFSVMVPQSQVVRAREVLYGEAPQGVTYVWPAEPATFAESAGPTASDDEFDVVPSRAVAGPKTRDGMSLSDNERMAHLAGGADTMAPPAAGDSAARAAAIGRRINSCALVVGVFFAIIAILGAILVVLFSR